ncbi:SET domain [Dillenia turbinata]|uniref:SET domain n=1 Tax=Dillenia turbinata TaxID=194707 RepID=A0AAN8W3B1_9MAGN
MTFWFWFFCYRRFLCMQHGSQICADNRALNSFKGPLAVHVQKCAENKAPNSYKGPLAVHVQKLSAMPPKNPRAKAALKAMKDLGISEEIIKPVLKKLYILYGKNWELIEEENYRALADAIFEHQETEAAEKKTKSKNSDVCYQSPELLCFGYPLRMHSHLLLPILKQQDGELDNGAQVPDEPERPLKRLRKRCENAAGSSISNSSPRLDETSLKRPKVEEGLELPEITSRQESQEMTVAPQSVANKGTEAQPDSSEPLYRHGKQPAKQKASTILEQVEPSPLHAGDHSQPHARDYILHSDVCHKDKGKQPMSPQNIPKERRLTPDKSILIKPKPEPFTDDVPHEEIPIAVILPDQAFSGASGEKISARNAHAMESLTSQSMNGEEHSASPPSSPSMKKTGLELANVSEDNATLEIASSPSGDVKILLSCDRPDFHVPSMEEVLKYVEDKCLRSFKIIDPKFSLMTVMRDVCERYLELGTASNNTTQGSENIENTLDVLKESTAQGNLDSNSSDLGKVCLPLRALNGPAENHCSIVLPAPQIPISIPLNAMDDPLQADKSTAENGCWENVEKEEEMNRSLVTVQQHQLTADDLKFIHFTSDISNGEENFKITVVDEINNIIPPSFHYIPQNITYQNAYVNVSLAQIGEEDCCPMCIGDCLSSTSSCACACQSVGGFAYTMDGLVKESFLEECISIDRCSKRHSYCKECPLERSKNDDILEPCKGHPMRRFIKECWRRCGCNKQCGNRVVQRGITCNLQVFFTNEGKGWGLRTLQDLPKGSFICEYVGEILTTGELYERSMQQLGVLKHSYSVVLDAGWHSGVIKGDDALCLDATHYGNIARFINHRCSDANLIQIPVEIETPNHHYYHLAFFTARKVDALEELTWDYGIDFDDSDHHVKAFQCKCGSEYCRNMKRTNQACNYCSLIMLAHAFPYIVDRETPVAKRKDKILLFYVLTEVLE